MVSALTIAFALRWADFYAANQIETAPYFVGILYGINIAATLIAIFLLFRNRRMSMPVSIRNRFGSWRQKLQERIPTPGSSNGSGA